MWQVNILWQQLFFCLDTPSLIPCSCPHCHWPRIKETYLQPSFIALLYHHVVMDLRGVGISHLLSSWRSVEQPLLLCWWLPPPSCGSLSLAWVRAECKDVEVFMAFRTKPFLTYSVGRWLYCLAFGYREKNHKQTAFHMCAELPAQNSINKPNTQYYLGYRVVPETLHRIACVCSTVYVFQFWSFKKCSHPYVI